MGRPGGVTTQSPGAVQDMIASHKMEVLADNIFRVQTIPYGPYRSKWLAYFFNGVYEGINTRAGMTGIIDKTFNGAPGSASASSYIEDAGDWAAFEGFVPSGGAEELEATTANRVLLEWDAIYRQSTVRGDTQLSSITITGASRGKNVEADQFFTTRASLTYSITSVGTTRIVRWYAGTRLVAEGSRSGNGSLTCSAMNGSGLSVACTITYSADIAAGTAYIELQWPESYQIHYSTSSLTFPRSPETTLADNGNDSQSYHVPTLAVSGTSQTYYFAVVPVMDGTAQSSGISTSSKTIYAPPASVTAVSFYGQADQLRTNLLPRSEQFTLGSWAANDVTITANSVANPLDGATANGASTFTVDASTASHRVQQLVTASLTNGSDYTFSCYLKKGAGTTRYVGVQFETFDAGAVLVDDAYTVADLQGGTITQTAGGATSAITAVGSDWYRVSVKYQVGAAIASYRVRIALKATNDTDMLESFLGDGSIVYAYGAQFELNTLSDYIKTAAASASASIRITFTPGESGCTHTVYRGDPNKPINIGSYALPTVLSAAADEYSVWVPEAVTGAIPTTRETHLSTLITAWASAISTCNASYTAAGFASAFSTLESALLSALTTFESAVLVNTTEHYQAIQDKADQIATYASTYSTLTNTQFKDAMTPLYGNFLAWLGWMTDATPGRFTLPNGAVGGGALGSATTGTGAAADGTALRTVQPVGPTLKDLIQPFTPEGIMRVVVRATKSGIQEKRDKEWKCFFTSAGVPTTARPNKATIKNISLSGLQLSINAEVRDDDSETTATHLYLFISSTITAPISTTGVPVATAALSTPVLGLQSGTLTHTVPLAGFYRFAVLAYDGTSRSFEYDEYIRYITNSAPSGVTMTALPLRGKGVTS